MTLTDIIGSPLGPRHIAISACAGLLSGAVTGIAVDRIFSGKVEGREARPHEPELETVVNLGEYSDYSVPEAFEKPDISDLTDYTKYFENEDDSHEKAPQFPLDSPMEIITEEEFLKFTGNEDGYVSVVGTWFPEDGVLAGWNDDLVEKDISKTIGTEAVELLREGDQKAVYVRNTAEKVLYEIIKGVGSLSSEIHPESDLE